MSVNMLYTYLCISVRHLINAVYICFWTQIRKILIYTHFYKGNSSFTTRNNSFYAKEIQKEVVRYTYFPSVQPLSFLLLEIRRLTAPSSLLFSALVHPKKVHTKKSGSTFLREGLGRRQSP